MFTVALVGPDGAGKTTIGRQLEHELPYPVKYVYMGVSLDSSNHMLPTTRLVRAIKRACGAPPDTAGPRDPHARPPRPKGLWRRALKSTKAGLSLANRLCEQWFRQSLTWYFQWRRHIVLFDRHYFPDYYAHDIAPTTEHRPWSRRVHGFVLRRLLPRPDVIICLDAPAEVLFARKGEGSVALLEQRRQEYLAMQGQVKYFAVVDATLPPPEVVRQVREHVWTYHRQTQARRPQDQPCCSA
jgi:thymidylate kinase